MSTSTLFIGIDISKGKLDQIKIKCKTAAEDPLDYLNGVVNDRYRMELGLTQPVSETELQKFKAYLDQNIKDWKDKDGEDIWKLVPKFRQTSLGTSQ